ncbi:hypothetical protein [Burkholderia gladioli]|uniref:hypothetical protein n=1 Tax=Burkholderia gladioli TaxID=28095 RepID=UPI0011D1CCDD|nr:hypothetical protein [Burkholderia gladioli]MBW5284847.1 hypothetical protein [Burkholderia gladioli]
MAQARRNLRSFREPGPRASPVPAHAVSGRAAGEAPAGFMQSMQDHHAHRECLRMHGANPRGAARGARRAGPIGRQPRRARLGALARQGADSRLSKWVPTHLFTWRHRSANDLA